MHKFEQLPEYGYILLSEAMTATNRAAVAQWNSRGKEHLVVVRPYRGGLILHQMFYSNEIRDFSEIETAKVSISDIERDMASQLIASLSSGDFDPAKYEDTYGVRVKRAIEERYKGAAAKPIPEAPRTGATFVDISVLLEQSIAQNRKPHAKEAPKADEPKKPSKN